jgi:AcrR family transcriptional regulator
MRKKESTEKIFSASLRVFATYGYKKDHCRGIARELNMTKGNLYLYVKDKEDLYRKTVEFALLRWQDLCRGANRGQSWIQGIISHMCHKAVEYLSIDDDFRSILIMIQRYSYVYCNDPYEKFNKIQSI